MKSLLLPVALCAALAGCATYVPYDYPVYTTTYPVQTVQQVQTVQPVYAYPPAYAYPYAYAYPPVYPYPYASYWGPSIWISGSYWCCSSGRHWHGGHRHR